MYICFREIKQAMKRIITTLSILFICFTTLAQNRIDFFDFYQKFNWDWAKESFEKQYCENVLVTSDGLILSNIVLGEHNGDMLVAIDEKNNKTVLLKYDIPVAQFDKSVELFKERLSEPASEEEKDGKSTLVWVNDNKILLLVNIDELCGFTCMPYEIWEQFSNTVNELQTSEHLKFKGIPIDGTPERFVDQLMVKGYGNHTIRNGMHIVQGPFAGFSDARVYVVATNNVVFSASVYVDFSDRWPEVKSAYLRVKDALTNKYNVKPKSVEVFPKYPSEGSGLEFIAFRDKHAQYESDFEVPYGIIRLMIVRFESTDGFNLLIAYYDTANSLAYYNNIEADL